MTGGSVAYAATRPMGQYERLIIRPTLACQYLLVVSMTDGSERLAALERKIVATLYLFRHEFKPF